MTAPTTPARVTALDGLRGVGIAVVVAYHLGATAVSGAWFLLDTFFVLSGFLITRILLSPTAASPGSFWARRALRLGPTVLVVVATVCGTARWWLPQAQLADLRAEGAATLAFAANWWHALSGSTYGPAGASSPLANMWTVAVEEQFYLLWPLVLLACRRTRHRLAWAGAAALGTAVASAAAMWWCFDPAEPWKVYFATPTHAHGLALGALAAVVSLARPNWGRTRLVHTAAWAGAAAMVVTAAMWRPATPARYGPVMLACQAAVALLVWSLHSGGPAPLAKVLSWRPLAALGAVSFEVYAWHWPVAVALDPTRTALSGPALLAVRLGVTALLVATTRWLLSGRALATARPDRALLGVAWGFVAAAVVVASLPLAPARPAAARPAAPARVDAPGAMSVLVVGDSVADSLMPGFRASAGRGVVVTSLTGPACGWAAASSTVLPADPPSCAQLRDRRALDAGRVDWVVATGAVEAQARTGPSGPAELGTPDGDRAALADLAATYDEVRAGGARLAVVQLPAAGPATEQSVWAPDRPAQTRAWAALVRRFARTHPDVVVVETDDLVCARPRCAGTRGADGRHYSAAGAASVARATLSRLVAER